MSLEEFVALDAAIHFLSQKDKMANHAPAKTNLIV